MTLSIITINYNHLDGLKKTIDSVISQSWHDYEWIIIDGGSSDGSKELIKQNQHLFSYWCSEPDHGVYDAMNKGISHVKGEYINFMNSGDVFASNDTLNLVFAHNHHGGVVYGDWIQVYNTHERHLSFPINNLHTEFLKNNICHQAMFYKSSLLKQKGYDSSMRLFADWVRNIELLLSGESFEYMPITICRYDMYGLGSREDLDYVRKEEKKKVESLYPQWVLPLIRELDGYRTRRSFQYTLELTNKKNCCSAFVTKAFLKFMYEVNRFLGCKV